MKIVIDDSYEELAAEWQYRMIEILKGTLNKYGVQEETAKEICGDFSFDLAMLQDQGRIKVGTEEYRPVICFENLDRELKYSSNVDFQLHDYSFGNTDEVFDK